MSLYDLGNGRSALLDRVTLGCAARYAASAAPGAASRRGLAGRGASVTIEPPPPPFANLCVPTRRTAAPPLAAESSPVHGVRAHACRYRAVLLEMSKGQQDYEHARRLNAPRRQGQLGTLYNFVKGLLQGRGFDSSYADMSGCVHVNRQTPQLSVSDTQVPWDCTGHIRGGFISMEMQI